MAIKTLAEIMEEMRKNYKRRPKEQSGWRVLAGTDSRGYRDIFFYGPNAGIWLIKGEPRTPYELVGAGARIAAKDVSPEIRELMERGRPMPFGFITPHPKSRDSIIIAAGVGRYGEATDLLKERFSSKQAKLELELRRKLDKLRHKLGLDVGYR
jgi:hypothetical protein